MAFKNILVPTDGSEYTKEAVKTAIELAKLAGGRITALYVLDHGSHNGLSTQIPTDSTALDYYRMLENDGKAAVNIVRDACNEEGVEVSVAVKEGVPYDAIIEESPNYDVIVMCTVGRSGMSKFLMGSVSERVVRAAKCPVLVVRAPTAEN